MFSNRQYFIKYLMDINMYSNVMRRCVNFKFDVKPSLMKFCQKTFEMPLYKIQSLMLQYPKLQSIEESQIERVVDTLNKLGVTKEMILKYPTILNVHTLTIENRWQILMECGLMNLTLPMLNKYVSMVRKRSISELKLKGMLAQDCDVFENLTKCFYLWPDIQNKLKKERFIIDPEVNLFTIRIEILRRFLRLIVDIPDGKFEEHVNTYLSMRHRSLTSISEVVYILKNELKFGNEKFHSHGYIYLLDPKNIKMILSEVKELGGLNIKEVLLKFPVIMKKNYKEILKIKQIMKEEGVTDDIQKRNLLVYTFNAETVRERIIEFKTSDHFNGLKENPRMCEFIYSRNKVYKRLQVLENANKKCTSLHKLITNTKEFDRFAQDFGDKTKGVDTLRALSKIFSPKYPKQLLRQKLLQHQYWTHVPIPSIIAVTEHLKVKFTNDEIFENCQLLLYSLDDVKKYTELLLQTRATTGVGKPDTFISTKLESDKENFLSGLDLSTVTNFQILSLVTYLLEKDHHFTCDGIWQKNLTEVKTTAVSHD